METWMIWLWLTKTLAYLLVPTIGEIAWLLERLCDFKRIFVMKGRVASFEKSLLDLKRYSETWGEVASHVFTKHRPLSVQFLFRTSGKFVNFTVKLAWLWTPIFFIWIVDLSIINFAMFCEIFGLYLELMDESVSQEYISNCLTGMPHSYSWAKGKQNHE